MAPFIASNTKSVVLFGDSFTARLQEFTWSNRCHNFHFDMGSMFIHWCGRGGLSLTHDEFYQRWTDALQWEPNILVLQLGSNDLCDPNADPFAVARGLVDIALASLRYLPMLQCVVIPQIVARANVPFDCYNQWVVTANQQLQALCYAHENLMFWYHSRIRYSPNAISPFVADGVHFNDRAQKIFLASIKGAILRVVSKFQWPSPYGY